jgi:hypothetical protein
MKFFKYGYPSQEAWELAKATISTTDEEGNTSYNSEVVVAVHEIGNICFASDPETGECTDLSTEWAVDILWQDEEPLDFVAYKVWPEPGAYVHVFAGWDAFYAQEYCEANPDAAYCQPPVPPIEE